MAPVEAMTAEEAKAAGVGAGARKRDSTPPVRGRTAAAAGAESASSGSAVEKEKPKKEEKKEEKEFGGPLVVVGIMVGSHLLTFYMATTLYGRDMSIFMPTTKSVSWFVTLHLAQLLFARIMPGLHFKGPTGLWYLCNAYSTVYLTIALAVGLHYWGFFDLADLIAEHPAFLTTTVILGNLYSVIVHCCYSKGAGQLFSIYDFFIGTSLHPRIGKVVDVKMVAEVRLSWVLLFLNTMGAYVTASRRLGTWVNPVAFMVLAHGLYVNACAKGEHFIPFTWDILMEKFGWMLCWWNLAGVPLTYAYHSLYLAHKAGDGLLLPPGPPGVYYGLLTVALLLSYWMWDEANYQKCYFKMEQRGEIINRNLFPTFSHIKEPKYLKCDEGVLLIDGWWAWVRKPAYIADIAMALIWGLACGFGSFLPYVHVTFFVTVLSHRAWRDEVRCSKKYGATWEKYAKAVPYRIVPGIF